MVDTAAPRIMRGILARPRGFSLARATFRTLQRLTVPVRRDYYLHGRRAGVIRRLPGPLRSAVGLDDESAIGSTRLEIGGGPHAQRGYLHVDLDRGAHHLEWIAPAWELPLADAWATEIVAIHILEHVPPSMLVPTLAEWRRVLRPGGRLQVHVPNGPALMEALMTRALPEKWPLMGSLLGMYCGPGDRDPGRLEDRSDHQIIFDSEILRWALDSAGFTDIEDLTGTVTDRHVLGWRELVDDYSLIARARRPADRA
jgi:SAM-dependent methyltransferase